MASLYPLKWNQLLKKTFRTIFDPWKKKNKLKKNTPPPQKKQQHICIIHITNIFHRFLFYSGLLSPQPCCICQRPALHMKAEAMSSLDQKSAKGTVGQLLSENMWCLDLLLDFFDWKVFPKTFNIFINEGCHYKFRIDM